MNTKLKTLSKNYYLFFNIPLQIFLIILFFLIDIDLYQFFIVTIFLYILIYWAGIQAGTHKLFSHKSWTPRFNFTKYILAVLSCYGLMGGPISWARIHRWHHKHSDTDKDPHSPKKGLFFSYFLWLLNPPDVPLFVVKDYINDKKLIFIEKNCKNIVIISLLILFFLDQTIGIAALTSMVLTFHSEMLVNTFMHKNVNNKYMPVNNTILSLFSGGSTLHKNHHENASSSCFSKRWYEIDLSYIIILLLKK